MGRFHIWWNNLDSLVFEFYLFCHFSDFVDWNASTTLPLSQYLKVTQQHLEDKSSWMEKPAIIWMEYKDLILSLNQSF